MATTAAIKEKYFRRQAFYWLVLAGAMLVAWFILWLASSSPVIAKDDKKKQAAEVADLPTRIESIGELNSFVPPIDFSTLVRDLRTYPAEFKDKNYFDNKKFTLQIMDVSQNEVIVNYLNARSDRDQFAYFRYLDENENPRYLLTYGKFDNKDAATAALQTTNFDLPASVTPSVSAMADYLKIIDDYERGEAVRDLSSRQPRQVKLQATRSEIPIQAATAADEALATKSRAQIQEKAAQIQSSAEDTAQVVTHTPAPAQSAEHDAPKDSPNIKPKAESEAPASAPKAEKPAEAPAESSATPTVNTPKVPGSE